MPDVTITTSQDGLYLVSGPVRVTDASGREIARPGQNASSVHRARAGSAIRPWTEHVRASCLDYDV
jgi:hypothetical protein